MTKLYVINMEDTMQLKERHEYDKSFGFRVLNRGIGNGINIEDTAIYQPITAISADTY